MNGANSYNICPRCGNSNSLSAKYCSRCGGQLKVPEEPIVCHKCHAHNSPMANFCRNCGTELKVGYESKICPRCGKEVAAHDNVCSCGYSFVTYQQTAPAKKPLSASRTAVPLGKESKSKKVYNTRGGRGWAIATLVLLLLFAYFLIAPSAARPTFLTNFDKGLTFDGKAYYFFDYIGKSITLLTGGSMSVGEAINSYGIANVIIDAFVFATVLTMLVQMIVCIVRIFTKKRSKHAGWYYFVMALLSLIAITLITLSSTYISTVNFFETIATVFRLPAGIKPGIALWFIPAYYLFFFLLSFGSRAKALKEKR